MFQLPQLTQTKAWTQLCVAHVSRDLLSLEAVNVMRGTLLVYFTHQDLFLLEDLEIPQILLCQYHLSPIRHHHQTQAQTILWLPLLHHLRRPCHQYHLHYHLHL